MMYGADEDPLCYPGTHVLRNRAGIKDAQELEQFEMAMFLIRAEEVWPEGDMDYAHYKAIHRHFFQDVYEWAGEPRRIRIGKGGNWFCYPEHIDREMAGIFAQLSAENRLIGLPAPAFAARAAHYLGDINAVHPFREGNGRTQLAFLTLRATRAGFACDEECLDRDRVMNAMIHSFHGNEGPLAALIAQMIGCDQK